MSVPSAELKMVEAIGFDPSDQSFVYSQVLAYAEILGRQAGILPDHSIPVLVYYIYLRTSPSKRKAPIFDAARRILVINVTKMIRSKLISEGVLDVGERVIELRRRLVDRFRSIDVLCAPLATGAALAIGLWDARGRGLSWPAKEECAALDNLFCASPSATTVFKLLNGMGAEATGMSWDAAQVADLGLLKAVIEEAGSSCVESLLKSLKLNQMGRCDTVPVKMEANRGEIYLPPLDWTKGNTSIALWTARRLDREEVSMAEQLLEPPAVTYTPLPHQSALGLSSGEPRLVAV